MRLTALALLAAALAVPSPSFAAARSCGLVTDPRGDSGMYEPAVESAVPSGDLDIVGADVATDRRTLTAVVRTATLAALDPGTAAGRSYVLAFTAGKERFEVIGSFTPDSTGVAVWRRTSDDVYEPVATRGVVVADYAEHEVRMSVPIGVFRTYTTLAAGTRLSRLSAATSRRVGNGPIDVRAPMNYGAHVGSGGSDLPASDAAAGTTPYVAGTPSCVRIDS